VKLWLVAEITLWVCRFAQFFLCPLFNADMTDREVKAVDSGEHILSDVCMCYTLCMNNKRMRRIFKMITGD